jgi:hypothetical protein
VPGSVSELPAAKVGSRARESFCERSSLPRSRFCPTFHGVSAFFASPRANQKWAGGAEIGTFRIPKSPGGGFFMSRTVQGKGHGKTIELEEDRGGAARQEFEITLRTVSSNKPARTGEGFLLNASSSRIDGQRLSTVATDKP